MVNFLAKEKVISDLGERGYELGTPSEEAQRQMYGAYMGDEAKIVVTKNFITSLVFKEKDAAEGQILGAWVWSFAVTFTKAADEKLGVSVDVKPVEPKWRGNPNH